MASGFPVTIASPMTLRLDFVIKSYTLFYQFCSCLERMQLPLATE